MLHDIERAPGKFSSDKYTTMATVEIDLARYEHDQMIEELDYEKREEDKKSELSDQISFDWDNGTLTVSYHECFKSGGLLEQEEWLALIEKARKDILLNAEKSVYLSRCTDDKADIRDNLLCGDDRIDSFREMLNAIAEGATISFPISEIKEIFYTKSTIFAGDRMMSLWRTASKNILEEQMREAGF